MRRLFAAATASLALACNGAKLNGVSGHLTVAPTMLDFGTTPVLFPVVHALTLNNVGGAPLKLGALHLLTPDGAYTLGAAADQIAAGGSLTVPVAFAPPAEKPYPNAILIDSDDPDHAQVQVPMAGAGSTTAAVAFDAACVDFGRVGEGHTGVKRVRLTSTGTADLAITGVAYDPASAPELGFVGSVKASPAMPAILHAPSGGAPGDAVDLVLRFSPTSKTTTPATGTLLIDTSDPKNQHIKLCVKATVNFAPIAIVGADQMIPLGASVTLDGSNSHDVDGDDPIAFAWTMRSKPVGSKATLVGAGTAKPTLATDLPGAYVLELVVVDSAGLASLLPGHVTITAVPPEHLRVEMIWDQPWPDFDLHLVAPGGAYGSSKDCTYNNPTPSFGTPGDTTQDPEYVDDVLGNSYGPESILYKDPVSGTYALDVNYYSDHGHPGATVNVTVRIYEYGIVVSEFTQALSTAGAVWNVCTIAWPGGGQNSGITAVNTVTGN